ncbi:hypothetical protein NPIL_361881 [Nephila pilipes]|uniref:Uncharacterized protein n=2 Tax=Nephila pilipes TaxID=299642 RepID=A0A8X6U9W0_NEPPI|nr:hypothetical protein NPIL_361881 [Nephila pilipes]
MHFQILDKLRIKKAEKRVSEQSHEARKTKRLKVIKDNENMRMKEGDVYVPGERHQHRYVLRLDQETPQATSDYNLQQIQDNLDATILRRIIICQLIPGDLHSWCPSRRLSLIQEHSCLHSQ